MIPIWTSGAPRVLSCHMGCSGGYTADGRLMGNFWVYLKRLRPFRRPLKRRRIIRFVTFQNECQLNYNLGLEGIEIFMVSTVFSGLLHHEDSWLRCFEIVPKSLYNLPKSFKNRLKIVVCGGALWRLEGVLGRLGACWSILGCLEGVLRASWKRFGCLLYTSDAADD